MVELQEIEAFPLQFNGNASNIYAVLEAFGGIFHSVERNVTHIISIFKKGVSSLFKYRTKFFEIYRGFGVALRGGYTDVYLKKNIDENILKLTRKLKTEWMDIFLFNMY